MSERWLRNTGFLLMALIVMLLPAGMLRAADSTESGELPLYPMLADYGGAIREKTPRADGHRHIDTPATIRELKRLHTDTYFFLIWDAKTDWDDLRREFLPAAQAEGIRVFAYLVPPSESKARRSEPFGTDYVAWFREIGRLSRQYPNLKGMVIDDFTENLSHFTPDLMKKIRAAGKKENPKILFYAQVYHPSLTPAFIKTYAPLVDGLVMAFRDGRDRNTQRLDRLTEQIDQIRYQLEQSRLPLILMVYASRLSATPASPSAEYVSGALVPALERLRLDRLQGVVTYVTEKRIQRKDAVGAVSGNAYASLFSPARGDARRDMVEWVQRVHVKKPSSGSLSFQVFQVSPSGAPKGAHVLQLLVDGKTVWQQDVSGLRPYAWHARTVHLGRHLQGKSQAVLSFRLVRTGKGTWCYTGIDDLRPEGFTVNNADFELGDHGWTVVAGSRGMIGDVIYHDPNRSKRTFSVVSKYYAAFRIYKLTSERTGPRLSASADTLLVRVLEGKHEESLNLLEKMIPLILFDKKLSIDEKQLLVRLCHDLHRRLEDER
ncbi:hypothetical protein [Staphylospora marina]|uniref:hypothetical protein n=1 Tax=Staphylospora marina TaxID=2490858 RepID=UPI000F5C0E2C|nr:hypothetical protein [Staphylospora marina]